MTRKNRAKSWIFEAVHETAGDLHRLGFIDKRKMREFDALCLDATDKCDSEQIPAPGAYSHGAKQPGTTQLALASEQAGARPRARSANVAYPRRSATIHASVPSESIVVARAATLPDRPAVEVTVSLDDESAALLLSLARTRRTKPEKLVSLVVQYWLEDEADIRAARHSRKASAGRPNVSLDEVKKRLGLED